jgi:hypothetical protein
VLFPCLHYVPTPTNNTLDVFPKIGSSLESEMIQRLTSLQIVFGQWISNETTDFQVFYKITGVGHWFTVTIRAPRFFRNGRESSSTRENTISFKNERARNRAFAILNSSLFYWFYQVQTNCRDFNPSDYKTFPVTDSLGLENFDDMAAQMQAMLDDSCSLINVTHKQTGVIQLEQFKPRYAKPIIDEIDRVLARHYGFTDEELDFIINYDIKYRLGDDLFSDDKDS